MPETPARVHRAEVLANTILSPSLRRITLGGADLSDYPTTASPDEYVRLFFPDADGAEPRLPRVVGRGWEFREGVAPSPMRTYTVRAHRPGEIDIDFVRHRGGLAAKWADDAVPGSPLGVSRPFAQFAAGAGTGAGIGPGVDAGIARLTLVADATALPAAERIIEEAPPGLAIRLFCEIADPRDARLPDRSPARVSATWVHRSGNGHFASRVADAFFRADLATDGSEAVWVAGEAAMTRRIRGHLRRTLRFPAAHTHIVGYWTDNEEAWRERFDALSPADRGLLDSLYADYGDARDEGREAVLDSIYALYERVGL